MVPPDSHRISRARCYLGYNSGGARLSGTGLSPSTATPSRGLPLTTTLSHSPPVRQNQLSRPTTPTTQPLPGITCDRFSLIRFRSPLLTESLLFSLPVGTEMFHFPTFPPHALCVQARVTPHDWCGVPPFGHPRINARLAAPRGLTQPPTSFIGSWCPGIHRVPLTTCTQQTPHTPPPEGNRMCGPTNKPCKTESEDARVHCAVLNQQPDTPTHPRQPTPTRRQPDPCKRYEDKEALTQPRNNGRPFPQDPTACLPPTHAPDPVPHPPPKEQAVLGARHASRPNWSAFHPRAPPHTHAGTPNWGTDHDAGAALDHTGSSPKVGCVASAP